MAADLGALCDDLLAEFHVLEPLLAPLDHDGWSTPTPAAGWDVRDQVAHLAYFDERALLSIVDPDRFRTEALAAQAAGDLVDTVTAELRNRFSGPETLAWFRTARHELTSAARTLDPSTRVPWYGPAMTIASSITARIMETWAHGIDIHDALGEPPRPSVRLRHVAFIGGRAFANSFVTQGRDVPAVTVRLELDEPGGERWTMGPIDAEEQVTGTMLDFCLLVTQRRHRADTDLVASGPATEAWLSIAQAFAGPPGTGRTAATG